MTQPPPQPPPPQDPQQQGGPPPAPPGPPPMLAGGDDVQRYAQAKSPEELTSMLNASGLTESQKASMWDRVMVAHKSSMAPQVSSMGNLSPAAGGMAPPPQGGPMGASQGTPGMPAWIDPPHVALQKVQPDPTGNVQMDGSPEKVRGLLSLQVFGALINHDLQGARIPSLALQHIFYNEAQGKPWQDTLQELQKMHQMMANPMAARFGQQDYLQRQRLDAQRDRQERGISARVDLATQTVTPELAALSGLPEGTHINSRVLNAITGIENSIRSSKARVTAAEVAGGVKQKLQDMGLRVIQGEDKDGNPVNLVDTVGDWRSAIQAGGGGPLQVAKPEPAGIEQRSRAAQSTLQASAKIRELLRDPQIQSQLGAVSGRVTDFQQFLGTLDEKMPELAGALHGYVLQTMGVHGMRSQKEAEELLSQHFGRKFDASSIEGALNGLDTIPKYWADLGRNRAGAAPPQLPPKGGGETKPERKQFVNDKTQKLEWFKKQNGKWVKE